MSLSFIRRMLIMWVVGSGLLMPVTGSAEEVLAPGSVSIRADSLTHEKETGAYHAAGNVRIEKDGMVLTCDSASLTENNTIATASGNIVMTQEDTVMYGDRLVINLETGKGDITNGYFYIDKGNIHLTGERIYKVGEKDYHLEKATVTTCETKPPSWKFSASELDVTMEEYAKGYNMLFHLSDVPVLYSPAFIFPVKRERQSGFLMARYGSSSKKGVNLLLPYYWAISPSQDATFTLDWESKRGVGAGVDYRYIRKTGSEGEARGFLIYDTEESMFRGEIAQKHQEILSSSLSFKSDINLVTDRDFLRDYAEETGSYNRQLMESTVSYTKNWALYSLVADLRFIQDLDAPNNRSTLQRLPTVTFTGFKQKLLETTPLFLSFDSNFTHFEREEGSRGQRLNLYPKLSYLYGLGGIVDITPWVAFQERIYHSYDGEQGDGFHTSGIPSAGLIMSTTLSRVYDMNRGDLKKIRHAIMPEINYTWVPEKNQDNLPSFDTLDRVVHQNIIYYSLANYLTAKYQRGEDDPTYRDLLYFKIGQGYELSGTRQDLLALADNKRPFTDIIFESRVSPTERISFSFDGRYNHYDSVFTTFVATGQLSDRWGDSASISYRYTRNEVEYLESSLKLPYFNPFIMSYHSRYSFESKEFLENLYTLEYRQQCWSVFFSYRDRLENKEFLVGFSLYGVGPLGDFKVF